MRNIVRFAVGFGVIFLFLIVGRAVTGFLGVPVPGSVVGMVLLTAALRVGMVPLRLVTPAAEVLLRHMAFFFVPPGVALVLFFDLIEREWAALLAGTAAGTFAVLLVVGHLQQWLERDD